MRAVGCPGTTTPHVRRLRDRLSGRDRSWIGSHPVTYTPPNLGSRTGSSHLAVTYTLHVDLQGGWRLTAHYTQPPSGQVSSRVVISSDLADHEGELRGKSWDGRRERCVTIVQEILIDLADKNGVTI